MNSYSSVAALAVLAWISAAAPVSAATAASQIAETPVPSLAPMIKRISSTVVGISIRGTIKDNGEQNPLFNDPFFRRFFNVPEQPREREFQAAGSGVVVDAKNGYIVTNAHVVENASEITVTLEDNRELKAKVIGSDKGSDIAILKVSSERLAAITLGDSSHLEVGDFVVAIGNPFGLQHTVTSGIVSALGRSGLTQDGYEDFIQTDASINPGNSGGALVNLRGELVGINSMIFSQSGGNIGIGFAIPVSMVKSVMDQLIKYGSIKRGILGVQISTLTPDVAKAVGAPADIQGSLVSQVSKGSAAEKAGIKVSDIITSINGRTVKTNVELRNSIGLLRVGDQVQIGLVRDGKARAVTAIIAEGSASETENSSSIHRGFEGAELADDENGAGVRVRSVVPNSPAARFGLRPHDLIVSVNRVRVASVEELRQAAKESSPLVLNVQRGDASLLILIR